MRIGTHTRVAVLFLALLPLAARAGDRPVVHLSFDQAIEDRGPFAFPIETHGGEVSLVGGKRGLGLYIGGTKDWIDVMVDDRLDFSKGATLELWFRREDWQNPYRGGSGWQTVAHLSPLTLNITAPGCPKHEPWTLEATYTWWLLNAEGNLRSPRNLWLASAQGIVPPRHWMHAALVYRPRSASLTLYIDGERSGTLSGIDTDGRLVTPYLRLGTWYQDNQAFRGIIDEVRVYDYPLSNDAIRTAAQH